MSETINITVSLDVPVGFVKELIPVKNALDAYEGAGVTRSRLDDTIERIKRFSRSYNPVLFKKVIENCRYHPVEKAFSEGEEVYYIGNDGAACKGKIKSIQYQVDSSPLFVERVFHSMEDLCEHLKKSVHG